MLRNSNLEMEMKKETEKTWNEKCNQRIGHLKGECQFNWGIFKGEKLFTKIKLRNEIKMNNKKTHTKTVTTNTMIMT